MGSGEEDSKLIYCPVCGRDRLDHDDDRPMKIGMKKFMVKYTGFTGAKYMGWGFKAKLDDLKYMLHQYRMNKLMSVRQKEGELGIGPRDDKIIIGSAGPSERSERSPEHSEGLGEGAPERSGGADVEGGMAGPRTEPLKDELHLARRQFEPP